MFSLAPSRAHARPAAVAATLLVALAAPIWAAPLSFADSLRLAEQRSQALAAQRAAAEAARERALEAAQRPDPVLQAGVNNLPITGPDRFNLGSDFMTARSVGVMQELTRPSKLKARAATFDARARIADAERLANLAILQQGTARAWLDRYYQEQMRALLRQERAQMQQQVQAAEAAYRGARTPQADVFAARGALAALDDRLARADLDVALATTALARWVGAAAAAEPLDTAPDVDQMADHTHDPAALVAHHPDLLMLDERVAAAQAEAEVARTNEHADVSVSLMLSQRGPGYPSMASINVSMPLEWDQKDRQERELAARQAAVEQARAERDEMAREHEAQVEGWLQQWRSDRERIARYDRELLPLAGQRSEAALAAYRSATGPLAAVLEARRAETDTQIERVRLEMDAARLWARLTYLVPTTGTTPAQP